MSSTEDGKEVGMPSSPNLLVRDEKFDLNWRNVHGSTITFQGCALVIDTSTSVVVRDLVEHINQTTRVIPASNRRNKQEQDKQERSLNSRNLGS
jgi:hypothetical protein